MLAIDLKVFVLINGLMACLMSLVLYFQWRTYPKSVKGLRSWSMFPLLAFAASLLYGTQGVLHHLLSIALPNVLLVLASLFMLDGTCAYFGKTLSRSLVAGVMGVTVVLMLFWMGEPRLFVYRVLYVCLITSAVFGYHLYLIALHRSSSFASLFMAATCVLIISNSVMRAVTIMGVPSPGGIFTPTLHQAVYLSIFGFAVLLLSISTILLSSEALYKALQLLVRRDELTGAMTRRALYEFGEGEVFRCHRNGGALSALALDLDHFKDINDRYGHRVGDHVLCDFVKRVQGVIRKPAVLGRHGGEEFVVLLPDTPLHQAVQVAERIRAHVSAPDELPRVTVSIGVATLQAGGQDSLEKLIDRADAVLYQAKHRGRDRVETALETAPVSVTV